MQKICHRPQNCWYWVRIPVPAPTQNDVLEVVVHRLLYHKVPNHCLYVMYVCNMYINQPVRLSVLLCITQPYTCMNNNNTGGKSTKTSGRFVMKLVKFKLQGH